MISAAELVVAVPLINIVPDGPVLDLDAVADVALGIFVEHTLIDLFDFAGVEEWH